MLVSVSEIISFRLWELNNLSFENSGPVDKVGVRAQKTNSTNSSDEDSPRDSRDESSSILLDT